jgi:hypothetical protein
VKLFPSCSGQWVFIHFYSGSVGKSKYTRIANKIENIKSNFGLRESLCLNKTILRRLIKPMPKDIYFTSVILLSDLPLDPNRFSRNHIKKGTKSTRISSLCHLIFFLVNKYVAAIIINPGER